MKKFIEEHPLVFSGVAALLLVAASVWGLQLGLEHSARALENTTGTLPAVTVQLEPAETSEDSEESYTKYAKFDWSGNPLQLPALTQEERARYTELLSHYTKGERPKAPAPDDPAKTGFAVVPLAPEAYEGLSQYVFLPVRALSDEELLQIIDYYAQTGTGFDPSSLNESNCMRGGCVEVNRARTSEEGERLRALEVRYTHEGLRPSGTALGADTASGKIVTVALNEEAHSGLQSFTFYPLRRLTDEELLELIDQNMRNSLYNREGFEADWQSDEAKCRVIARALFDMEESAVLEHEGYLAGDAVRPDTYMAHFEATQRDGSKRWYVVHIDVSTDTLYNAATALVGDGPQPTAAPGTAALGGVAVTEPLPEPDLNDPKWTDAAKAFAVKCSLASGNQIISARAYETYGGNAGMAVNVALELSDGASVTLGVLQENMQIRSVTCYKEGFDVDAYLKSIG